MREIFRSYYDNNAVDLCVNVKRQLSIGIMYRSRVVSAANFGTLGFIIYTVYTVVRSGVKVNNDFHLITVIGLWNDYHNINSSVVVRRILYSMNIIQVGTPNIWGNYRSKTRRIRNDSQQMFRPKPVKNDRRNHG